MAAFVKRMARLCLIAPPADIQIMVAFIGNLLIRHPSLKVLIQNDSLGKFTMYISYLKPIHEIHVFIIF